jgi:hypothetical protein
MKLTICLLPLLLVAACRDTKSEVVQKRSKPSHSDTLEANKLKELEGLKLARYHDSAKWRVYFYHCDDTCISSKDNKKLAPTPLGFLKLKLTYVSLEDERLTLLYQFLYDDTTDVRYTNKGYNPNEGVEFNVKDGSVIGYTTGNGTFKETGKDENGVQVRYENPTHPDVLNFISEHRNELNNWFRNEAIRRNLLRD